MRAQEQDLVTGGRFNFGRFDRPFRRVNPLDAQPYTGLRLPGAVRDFRLKEWQAFQLANDRYFMIVVLFNAKLMSMVQLKIVDRHTGKKHVFERQVTGLAFRAPDQLIDSVMRYDSRGCRVEFRNRLGKDQIEVELDIPRTRTTPAVKGTVRALYAGQQPLVVSIPFGSNRGMYSHKGIAPAEGELQIGDERAVFGDGQGYLLMDDHRGYYPWIMRWDWVTGGVWRDGRLLGFNLTANASIDPERYNENGIWVDGTCHPLPPVQFLRNRERAGETWSVRDREGRVDLRFHVEVEGRVNINLLVVRSKYQGHFGHFEGHILDGEGTRHDLKGFYGMGEKFYLRV